uniref:C2H2-type domain-containing protein n=1 Tax=Culex tarsalis TaxID=7177 RepID=A0A1Q3EY15_CULTA
MSENLKANSLSEEDSNSEHPIDSSLYVYVETDIKPEPSSETLKKSSAPRHQNPPPYERCDFCFQLLQPETSVHFDASGQFALEKKIEFVLATDLADRGGNPPRCCAHCWHMFELFAGFKRSCLVALRRQEELRAFEIPGGAPQTEVRVVARGSLTTPAHAPEAPPSQYEQIPKVMPSGTVTQIRYSCDTCTRSFASSKGLGIHRPQCKKFKTERKFRCKLCPATFNRPLVLQYHLNWHNKSKPFRCRLNNCIAMFHSETRRTNHEKEVLKDPDSRCTVCHKKVRAGSSMKHHMKQYHKKRRQPASSNDAMEESSSDSDDSVTKM